MKRLKQEWQRRSGREKQRLKASGLLLAVAGCWLGGWQSLQRAIDNQHQRQQLLMQQWRLLQRMPSFPQEAGDLRHVLEKTLAGHSLVAREIKEHQGQLHMVLEPGDANNILSWLEALEKRNGVRILALEMHASDPPDGRARVMMLHVGRQ